VFKTKPVLFYYKRKTNLDNTKASKYSISKTLFYLMRFALFSWKTRRATISAHKIADISPNFKKIRLAFIRCTSLLFSTLLGRGFFVFLSLARRKKKPVPGRVCNSSALVIIRPKVWTGKYQDHLANDGVSSRVCARQKIKHDLAEVSFFISPEGKIQRNLC